MKSNLFENISWLNGSPFEIEIVKEMKLVLFLCFALLCESLTFHDRIDSLDYGYGQDFRNLMDWIDVAFQNRCPALSNEVMERRDIGDRIVQHCVTKPKRSQCRFFVISWGFVNAEYM